MNVRPWTAEELERAAAYRTMGLSFAAVGAVLGRGGHAVRAALDREAARHRRSEPMLDLAGEIAAARAERATAPLLRTWPVGLWE
ncbi:MAG TPA: hypothetical protein VNH21_13590 [Steroidobacteraceae bacterium]|nr:hypothetical protein [Steroidobacteraceae bacterium]